MKDRQTNRMVQVWRGADQKEQAPGPRKPPWWGSFGYCDLARLHLEQKGRVVFRSVRNWLHWGGVENGAQLIPPLHHLGTAVQYPRFPILVPDQKSAVERGWGGKFGFFQKKTVGWLRIKSQS